MKDCSFNRSRARIIKIIAVIITVIISSGINININFIYLFHVLRENATYSVTSMLFLFFQAKVGNLLQRFCAIAETSCPTMKEQGKVSRMLA